MCVTLRRFTAPLLVALLVILLSAYALVSKNNWGYGNDSYRYARASLQMLGESRGEAHLRAVEAFCRTSGASEGPRCLERYRHSLPPDRPRYERIFDARPGYPLLAAPFIAAFGVLKGLWVLSLALTMVSSLLVYKLLRWVRARRYVAVAGQVLFLAGGLGYAGMRALADSPVTFFALVCAVGALRVLQTGSRAGFVWLLAGLGPLALTKYSTALLLAVCLAATAGAYACMSRRCASGSRRPLVLAGACAGFALVTGAVTAALGLPGLNETVQDLLSDHFTKPDAPDPLGGMLALEARFWPGWAHANTAFVLLLAVSVWALWRSRPLLGVPAVATGLTGLGLAAVHPAHGDRIWILAWVPVVLGVPLLLDMVRTTTEVTLPATRRPAAVPERGTAPEAAGQG